MYARILVPTDGSSAANYAATHALELAEQFDATVLALYVVEPIGIRDRLQGIDDIDAELENHGRKAVDRIVERADKRGLSAEGFIRHGSPAQEITQFAVDQDADAIVIGTHGRTGVDRALMGSVTGNVIRLSTVPVVTVRVGDHEQVVKRPDQAKEIARKEMRSAGHEAISFPESPSRQANSWVVRTEAGGQQFNVHIDSTSGESHIVSV